eukprot:COSAG02_NODE_421_length_22605_cov_158.841198_22_plen_83_part_00
MRGLVVVIAAAPESLPGYIRAVRYSMASTTVSTVLTQPLTYAHNFGLAHARAYRISHATGIHYQNPGFSDSMSEISDSGGCQ